MQRNLLRHLTWQLPSGHSIAREMGMAQLSSTDVSELQAIEPRVTQSTPLLYYILKEAEVMEGGSRLGPVRSDRGRGIHRAAAARLGVLSARGAELAAKSTDQGRVARKFSYGRFLDLCGGRSGK